MRLLRLFKRDLHREFQEWVQEGLVSESQAEAISQRFGIDYHDQSQHSFGYYILVALGFVFIGLAIITLVGANWENIPRAVRMLGLILVTLSVNGLGLYAWYRQSDKAATLWFFLGAIMYGASIMLIAQIYHIDEHYPDGIFWWAAGSLPAALLLRSNLLMTLAMVLAFIWFFVESGLDFYPVLFPAFLLALAWQIMRWKQSVFLFLVLAAGVGLVVEYSMAWYMGGASRFAFRVENTFTSFSLFVFYYGLATWLSCRTEHRFVDYGVVLKLWVLRFTILVLFILSFKESWRGLLSETWTHPGLVLVVSKLFLVSAIGLSYLATRSLLKSIPVVAFAVLYLVVLFVVYYAGSGKGSELVLQLLINTVLVVVGVSLIVQGVRVGVTHYFYLGIFTVLLTAMLRYIDLVGDYVGAAILFIVFAVILLVSARYWKNHLYRTGEGL